jgi:hypothetical protein
MTHHHYATLQESIRSRPVVMSLNSPCKQIALLILPPRIQIQAGVIEFYIC